MKVKNNYDECITSIACSIRKYFELEYHHNTFSYIDELLEKENYENVVVILFDGMGSNIIDRHLEKDDFFIKNRYKSITTVFPATTTAATTSVRTGLNPVEHGWLGWNTYLSNIDKTITLFLNMEKGKNYYSKEASIGKKSLVNTTICDEINKEGKYSSVELFPFGDKAYSSLDDMLERIEKETLKPGKKYIYAYNDEPDHTMHVFGPDSIEAISLIKERNIKTEKLCQKLKNTLVIILADHGHIKCENIYLKKYPDIYELLERTTSIEQRACSFKIKEGKKALFEELFNKYFGNDFNLYSKDDVIKSKLFGDGEENPLFRDALGDYLAIGISNKCLLTPGDEDLYSMHAGYNDDEILIPIIIVKQN